MSKNNILKNVGWLTIGLLIAKVFGGIYKLLLTRILGGEGLGVYQQILPMYSFLIILITSGVPLAISKMMATRSSQEEKVKLLSNSLGLFFILSIVVSAIFMIFASSIARLQGNVDIEVCYYLIIPCLVFSAMSAVFKGYFQGANQFTPSAISQIAEQVAKIVFGLGLSWGLTSFGVKYQIVGAIIGISLADIVNFVVLFILFKKQKQKLRKFSFNKKEIKELVAIVFPIMLASLIIPFSQMIDSVLVVKLLNRNFVGDMSVYLYGLQSGIVSTLVNLPSVLTFSISTVLLPRLTQDYKEGKEHEFSSKVSIVVKFLLLIIVPCCLFVLFYPNQIIGLIYGDKINGFNVDGQMLTSKLLLFSAVNIVFLCLSQFFSICLQAREKRYLPAVNNLLGMIVKTILIICFVPSRELNIMAYTLANSVGYFVIFMLNFVELQNDKVVSLRGNFLIKLAMSNIAVLVLSVVLLSINTSLINFVITIVASVVVYLFVLWFIKPFNKTEIKKVMKNNF